MSDVLANGLGEVRRGNAPTDPADRALVESGAPSERPRPPDATSDGLAIEMTALGTDGSMAGHQQDDGLDAALLDPSMRDLGELTTDSRRLRVSMMRQ